MASHHSLRHSTRDGRARAGRLGRAVAIGAIASALAIVALGCSTESLDLNGKQCPCAADWRCDTLANRCVQTAAGPEDAAAPLPPDAGATPRGGGDAGDAGELPRGDAGPFPPCAVRDDDHRLWCTNRTSPMYAGPDATTAVVDDLWTTYSWFDCWTTGALHEGGNTTWYHTSGDKNGAYGYVPAVRLDTLGGFDADPTAHGLARCSR